MRRIPSAVSAVVRVGRLTIVVGFTVAHGRIAAIDLIADPAKLGGVDVS